MSEGSSPPYAYVGEDDSGYFRTVHGRKLNALNSVYLLPVDEDAVKVPTKSLRNLLYWLLAHSRQPSVPNFTTACFNLSLKGATTWDL